MVGYHLGRKLADLSLGIASGYTSIRRMIKMPQGKHLRGVSSKEEREYEHILESAKKEGRYGNRAKEVAARTVMKHHAEEGHSKGE